MLTCAWLCYEYLSVLWNHVAVVFLQFHDRSSFLPLNAVEAELNVGAIRLELKSACRIRA